jgi:hypothetical protein
MSQDRLGPITRALVGIDRRYLGTVADVINRFNSVDVVRWNHRFKGVLQEGLPPLEPLPPLLVFDNEHVATVTLDKSHVPAEFWRDTDDVPARRVWGAFVTVVVARAKPLKFSGVVKVPYADLSRATTFRDIRAYPGVGDFDPTVLSAIIAGMIGKQSRGEEGDLLNDGLANLFPCGPVLICVNWNIISKYWCFHHWTPGCGLGATRRVFSGNLKYSF